MHNLIFLASAFVASAFGHSSYRNDASLGHSQPIVGPANSAPSESNTVERSKSIPAPDFEAVVRELGAAVTFDQMFTEVQGVPRYKDEFETASQFEERQAVARAKCRPHYLVATPIDPEHVRYDADQQKLIVATYALTNTLATSTELSSAFGYGSELSKAKVEVKYSVLSNVMWSFPREQRDVGTYTGSNAFGATVTITKQKWIARGVFEREGAYSENVWAKTREPSVKGSVPVAFEIKTDQKTAKLLKQGGLRAAILVAPRAPYYATGVDYFAPTVSAPYDRTTDVRIVVGDVQCVAIYGSDGNLLATRSTQ